MIDGDAARAARREALGRHVVYRLGGRDWHFPVEMPLTVLDLEKKAEDEEWTMRRFLPEAIRLLLADQAADFFAIPDLSEADLVDCWNSVLNAYAVTPGESQPSPDSSTEKGGGSSKRNSSGSTRSTRGRSGAAAVSAA